MTIFELSIISTTGHPYYNVKLNDIPEGVIVSLRFFDFSHELDEDELIDPESRAELTAGLISALFEFSRAIDKKIHALEFQSRSVSKNINIPPPENASDTLITCMSESFLNKNAIKKKITLLYHAVIEPKIPLITADELLTPEQDLIWNILTDNDARTHFKNKEKIFSKVANEIIMEYRNTRLEGICVFSFDYSILGIYGSKYSLEAITTILRDLKELPEVIPRHSKVISFNFQEEDSYLIFMHSGIEITIEILTDKLFEPFYYCYICNSKVIDDDVVNKITRQLNDVLEGI
ncbi:MAG: hypothetical protein JW891_15370 [Candidatus Lokiarchaeota archaeon]|nr:hypothetical protein [Candidatus Lokiarchaeota archaeon]